METRVCSGIRAYELFDSTSQRAEKKANGQVNGRTVSII